MALRFDSVSKSYPRWTPGSRGLKDVALRRVPALMRYAEQRMVLRDVSFTVEPGEAVGVVGHNGAGKSTLLRLAAGLGRPTRGRVVAEGDTRALLTLGDTFDPTLSGADNAVTAAMIAGLSEREARRQLPDVLAFAELEAFADAPVRTYSDGMKLRLAMGVAVQVPARVLVIDEVLAVGDLAFQERCLEYVRRRRAEGTALLFASHDLDRIAGECDRALWLSGGTVRKLGPARAVVDDYRRAMMSQTLARTPSGSPSPGSGAAELGRTRFGTQEATVEDVRLAPAGDLVRGGDLSVTLRVVPRSADVTACVVAVSVHRRVDGVKCLDANTANDGIGIALAGQGVQVTLLFEQLTLAPGAYDVEVGAYRTDWEYAYDLHVAACGFRVSGHRTHDGVIDAGRRWAVTA